MVETAKRQHGGKRVLFLLGGFHLLRDSEKEIAAKIGGLKSLGVASVAPTHCTGDRATTMFREAFGAAFRPAGAGSQFSFD
jgi:7,8-dihydropterin-6-yl-methyl-4-(beta-D-ribofuranosyl)aminobenzene 5'-phosphate synthase